MNIGYHSIGRLGLATDIDRAIVNIILRRGLVTPGGIPIASVEVVVATADQLNPIKV